MKTVNSLSGGKTSSYMAINYPADYNVFSLVRTNDKSCEYPDAKVRQIVSDLIGCEFVGTLEQNNIITVMLKLSEKVDVDWITGETFDEVVKTGGGLLPNMMRRYCTTNLKIIPIQKWWREKINETVEMRIGFRANEIARAERLIEKCDKNGIQSDKFIIGKSKNGKRNRWGMIEWRKPVFPLIEDNLKAIDVDKFWKENTWIGFKKGYYNNCVGCFHRSPLFLNKMSQEHKSKMEWFAKKELIGKGKWKSEMTYNEIMKWNPQIELTFDDFNECDSGYCGL
tara:strand:+ start:25 stop:870 length:846 start_codon:yes stop_codon:yes gene_type:complete